MAAVLGFTLVTLANAEILPHLFACWRMRERQHHRAKSVGIPPASPPKTPRPCLPVPSSAQVTAMTWHCRSSRGHSPSLTWKPFPRQYPQLTGPGFAGKASARWLVCTHKLVPVCPFLTHSPSTSRLCDHSRPARKVYHR